MNKSAFKRKERSDKGKPRKSRLTPEYWSYLAREHASGRKAKLSEAELLAILAQGCALCSLDATMLRAGKPYCLQCDGYVGVAGEAQAVLWARRIAL